jgi:hypothetical protein
MGGDDDAIIGELAQDDHGPAAQDEFVPNWYAIGGDNSEGFKPLLRRILP